MAVWDRKNHGAWHLHGHSHGKFYLTLLDYYNAMLDVGVDCQNYYPMNIMYGMGVG